MYQVRNQIFYYFYTWDKKRALSVYIVKKNKNIIFLRNFYIFQFLQFFLNIIFSTINTDLYTKSVMIFRFIFVFISMLKTFLRYYFWRKICKEYYYINKNEFWVWYIGLWGPQSQWPTKTVKLFGQLDARIKNYWW